MEERIISQPMLEAFRIHLLESEKSAATIEKYMRDVRRLAAAMGEEPITRQRMTAYKTGLPAHYAITSANSMLAAANAFLRFMGWMELCIRQFRVQRPACVPEEKELTRAEYERLVRAASITGNERLSLILQTICATGIRVSELRHITVQALHRGEAAVRCKGKCRVVFIVQDLRRQLLGYARRRGITAGPVFVTRSGAPVNRTAIWRDMKALCARAHVSARKVFPHNLRHLFARTFYGLDKDIAILADILGHSSINTTRIYVAATASEHRRRIEQLHLIIGQKKKPAG